MKPFVGSLLWVSLSIGCDGGVYPQVLVRFTADDASGSRANALEITVLGPDGGLVTEPPLRAEGEDLVFPLELPLSPRNGDASRSFALTAELLDADGVFQRQRLLGGYTPSKLIEVTRRFDTSCMDILDCAPDQTCVAGACAGACIDGSDPERDLLAWYKMEEADPDHGILDAVGGHDGSCTRCPTATNGRAGGALMFHAATMDLVSIDYPFPEAADGFTVAMWLRADAAADATVIAKPYGGCGCDSFQVGIEGGVLEFTTNNGTSGKTIEDLRGIMEGRWVHVAAVWNGQFKRLYVDGVEVARRARTPAETRMDASAVTLGGHAMYGRHLTGAIDDVRIYGRGLCESEIAAIAAD